MSNTNHLECNDFPYQSIDSGLFYKKINDELKKNKNISFYKNIKDINTTNSFIFNSVPLPIEKEDNNLWQHFCGIEIEAKKDTFDEIAQKVQRVAEIEKGRDAEVQNGLKIPQKIVELINSDKVKYYD